MNARSLRHFCARPSSLARAKKRESGALKMIKLDLPRNARRLPVALGAPLGARGASRRHGREFTAERERVSHERSELEKNSKK